MDKSQKKILIVEDDQFLREFYQELLQSEGYLVDVARDGEVGLQKAKAGGYDLVLLDIMLPGMNGLQLLREFKTQNPASTMITILLTNLGQEAVIKEGFELGAQAYLIKASYTPDQVVNEVKNALFGSNQTPTPPATPNQT